MTVYSRADWGAQPSRRPLVAGPPADSLVVHHVGSGLVPPATHDACCAVLRSIQAQHMASAEGYSDIAYNMAVSQAGDLYILRGMDNLGAATFSANDHTRAVVWLGDSGVTTPAVAAQQAIAGLYDSELGRNLTAGATITGHRDWTATACPGDAAYSLLPAIRQMAGDPTPYPNLAGDDMAVTIIDAVKRPTAWNGRTVWDLVISGPARMGGTTVASTVAIMPVDPQPCTVDVFCTGPDGSVSATVPVDPAVTFWAVPFTGRVSVVCDPAKPVLVYGREVHYAG